MLRIIRTIPSKLKLLTNPYVTTSKPNIYQSLPSILPEKPTYSNLLDSAFDCVGNKEKLVQELSLKKIINKNQEMKKIIFKMVKVAATEIENSCEEFQKHPFVYTAGEVFFGDEENDMLTPGLLILLLNRLVNINTTNNNNNNTFNHNHDQSHMQLAKGLVETVAGYQIHRTIQETNDVMTDTNKLIHQGNKLATLTGDLLVVSLIQNIAATGNNKVLELIMQSLSEFSNTEVRSIRSFKQRGEKSVEALLPQNLAESSVFSKGFQSSMILSRKSPEEQMWAAELGHLMGLLWKTNFDLQQLNINRINVINQSELDKYLHELSYKAVELLMENRASQDSNALNCFRNFINYWAVQ